VIQLNIAGLICAAPLPISAGGPALAHPSALSAPSVLLLRILGCLVTVLVFWDIKSVFYALWTPFDFLMGYTDPRKSDNDRLHGGHRQHQQARLRGHAGGRAQQLWRRVQPCPGLQSQPTVASMFWAFGHHPGCHSPAFVGGCLPPPVARFCVLPSPSPKPSPTLSTRMVLPFVPGPLHLGLRHGLRDAAPLCGWLSTSRGREHDLGGVVGGCRGKVKPI
jgi:hypothetical protein